MLKTLGVDIVEILLNYQSLFNLMMPLIDLTMLVINRTSSTIAPAINRKMPPQENK